MPSGEAFADVLQQKLQELQPDGPVLRPQPTDRPVPPLPFLFIPAQPLVGATPYRSTVSPLWRGPQVRLPGPGSAQGRPDTAETRTPHVATPKPIAVETARMRRTLTLPQQKALEKFVWLGSGLGADFNAAELRSAFRALALRYHPDRHPNLADAERARLARLFAEVSECHRQLVAVVDAPRH